VLDLLPRTARRLTHGLVGVPQFPPHPLPVRSGVEPALAARLQRIPHRLHERMRVVDSEVSVLGAGGRGGGRLRETVGCRLVRPSTLARGLRCRSNTGHHDLLAGGLTVVRGRDSGCAGDDALAEAPDSYPPREFMPVGWPHGAGWRVAPGTNNIV